MKTSTMNNTNTTLPLLSPSGQLYNYDSGEYIREATSDELLESLEAASWDGGAGVITVDGARCYVTA